MAVWNILAAIVETVGLMDTVDQKIRSKIMASVGQKDTKPEMVLRKALHRMGFRYVANDKRLPGSPDLVFPKYHAVIFVHGCFWHRHGCKYSTMPQTRRYFWEEKFEANKRRDLRKISDLRKKGWNVKVVWECKLKGSKNQVHREISTISKWLKNEETPSSILSGANTKWALKDRSSRKGKMKSSRCKTY